MEFRARIEETDEGDFLASCFEPRLQARGLSPANALDRLRAELRYWVELCPCSGVEEDDVRVVAEP